MRPQVLVPAVFLWFLTAAAFVELFAPPEAHPVGGNPFSVTAADLDEDLAAADYINTSAISF